MIPYELAYIGAESDVFGPEPETNGIEGQDPVWTCAPRSPAPKAKAKTQKEMRILLVEDDASTADHVTKGLREQGHKVDWARDGQEGLEMARAAPYDVLIVDRGMPRRSGVSLVRILRSENISTPAVFLSAHSDVNHRIEGLEAGADDYVSKPFSFAELFARIDAINRRANPIEVKTKLVVGELEMDLLSRKVWRAGQEILLQPREFRLLEYLMKHAEQVVTRTMLLENVWEYHFDPQTNVIDVHISRLRAKIDKAFDGPMLHTIRGAGYSLRTPE